MNDLTLIPPGQGVSSQEIDRPLHSQMARFTQGVSPAYLAVAYMDWLIHLALSPGKR
ncbi:MAG: poly-beta-hydroxybutyrate polymerase N-terminal domain-containing protein, partial [Polaromonas sp.]